MRSRNVQVEAASDLELAEIALLQREIIYSFNNIHTNLTGALGVFVIPRIVNFFLEHLFPFPSIIMDHFYQWVISNRLTADPQNPLMNFVMNTCQSFRKNTQYIDVDFIDGRVRVKLLSSHPSFNTFAEEQRQQGYIDLRNNYNTYKFCQKPSLLLQKYGHTDLARNKYLKWVLNDLSHVNTFRSCFFAIKELTHLQDTVSLCLGYRIGVFLRRKIHQYPLGLFTFAMRSPQKRLSYIKTRKQLTRNEYEETKEGLIDFHSDLNNYKYRILGLAIPLFTFWQFLETITSLTIDLRQDENAGFLSFGIINLLLYGLFFISFTYHNADRMGDQMGSILYTNFVYSELEEICKNLEQKNLSKFQLTNVRNLFFCAGKKFLYYKLLINECQYASKKQVYLGLRFAFAKHGYKILECDRNGFIINPDSNVETGAAKKIVEDCKIYFARINKKYAYEKQLNQIKAMLNNVDWYSEEYEDSNQIPNFQFYLSIPNSLSRDITSMIVKLFNQEEIMNNDKEILIIIKNYQLVSSEQMQLLQELSSKTKTFEHKSEPPVYRKIKKHKIDELSQPEPLQLTCKETKESPPDFKKLKIDPFKVIKLNTFSANEYAYWDLNRTAFDDRRLHDKYFNIFQKGQVVGRKGKEGFVKGPVKMPTKEGGIKFVYGLFKIKCPREDLRIYETASPIHIDNNVIHVFNKVVSKTHR